MMMLVLNTKTQQILQCHLRKHKWNTNMFRTLTFVCLLVVASSHNIEFDSTTGKSVGNEEIINNVKITKFSNIPLVKRSVDLPLEWAYSGSSPVCLSNKNDCSTLDVHVLGDPLFLNKKLLLQIGDHLDVNLKKILEKNSCSFYDCKDLVIISLKSSSKTVSENDLADTVEWIKQNEDVLRYDPKETTIVAANEKNSETLVKFLGKTDFHFHKAIISHGDFEDIHVAPLVHKKTKPTRFLIGVDENFCHVTSIPKTKLVAALVQHVYHVTVYERVQRRFQEPNVLGMWFKFAVASDDETFKPAKSGVEDEFTTILKRISSDSFPGFESKLVTCDSLRLHNTPYLGPYASEGEQVNVATKLGDVIGRHVIRATYMNEPLEADAFWHIPYGKEPVRFEHSEIVEPWSTPLDARYALKYKECPQQILKIFGTEDCLNLNIFVPGTLEELKTAGTTLPVMVFFHGGSWEKGTGGGLNIGDNHIYDGSILANIGQVIVVSVSYRVGALGFMNDGEDNNVLEGNYGIRDMLLSLQWIQANIDDYAGDKSQVTVFGQSAGSTAVSLLGLSPMTNGLLQGIIAESGAATSFFSYDPDPKLVADVAVDLLGCRSSDPALKIECLRQRNAHEFPALDVGYNLEWRPTIDNEFLTDTPRKMLETYSNKYNMLIGFNSDDVSIIVASMVPAVFTDANMTFQDMEEVSRLFVDYAAPYPDKQEYISPVTFHASLDWLPGQSDTTNAEMIFSRVGTDYAFGAPTIETCDLHSTYSSGMSTYMYLFNIKSRLRILPDWVYNSHAFELPYVFGETLRSIAGQLYDEDAKMLSLQMMTYWSNFAKSGDPNLPVTEYISNVPWNQYDTTNKQYNVLDFKMAQPDNMATNYRPYENALFNELLPELLRQDEEDLLNCPLKQPSAEPNKREPKTSEWLVDFRKQVQSLEYADTYELSGDGNCDLTEAHVRETVYGCVRGSSTDYNGVPVEAYLGIPYADAPVGGLRFVATQFVATNPMWSGTLNTQAFRPICPRDSTMAGQDEDCLYLNVYRPESADTTLPIMVWFHPDIDSGDGSQSYEGYRIAAEANVILVTVNYRIGIFGFLNTGSDGVSGNLGLLDQAAALFWVRRNAANFGGDRNAVTLFGDSDSSRMIGYHVAAIASEGLFHKVIHQSGAGEFNLNLPTSDFEQSAAVAAELGCGSSTSSDIIDCLTNADVATIMAATEAVNYRATIVIDMVFLLDQPGNVINRNRVSGYPFLIGITSGEGSEIYDSTMTVQDRVSFQQFTSDHVTGTTNYNNPQRIQFVIDYEYLKLDYTAAATDMPQQYQEASVTMYGDKEYVAPSFHIANYSTNVGSSAYLFELSSSIDTPTTPEWVGTPHGEISNYIWFTGGSADDQTLADSLLQYYREFVWTGIPGASWKAYDVVTWEINKLNTDTPTSVSAEPYPRLKSTTLWNVLVPAIDFVISCDDLAAPDPEVISLGGVVNSVSVTGYTVQSADGTTTDIFHGIPYAEPPIGDNRFKPSVAATVTAGVGQTQPIELTLSKPRCIETQFGIDGGHASEDCLYLDIWRPRITPIGPINSLSTLVWFCNGGAGVNGPHGQQNDDESCNIDGQLMAVEAGIIFVRVSYRTGVFGFLAGDDPNLKGNLGLSDALNAVEWVTGNIGAFGGNGLTSVSVGGNGFGATLALHVASRNARINKVVAQSGAMLTQWAYQPNPQMVLQKIADRLMCVGDVVECVTNTNAAKLTIVSSNLDINFPFGLYVKADKEDSFANWRLDELTVNGRTLADDMEENSNINLLIGVNSADGFQFTMDSYEEMRRIRYRRPVTNNFIERIVSDDIYISNYATTRAENQNNILTSSYSVSGIADSGAIRRSAVEFHTDEGFIRPMYHEISHKTNNSAYVYVYYGEGQQGTGIGSNVGVSTWQNLGASFGEDMQALFVKQDSVSSQLRTWWGNFVGVAGQPALLFPNRWNNYNIRQTMMYVTSLGFERVQGYKENVDSLWNDAVPALTEPIVEVVSTTERPAVTEPPMTQVPVTCPTLKPVTVTVPEPATCPEMEPLGGGIGMSLTPKEADVAINTLFGLTLTFACVIVIMIGFFVWYKSKMAAAVVKPSKNGEVIPNVYDHNVAL